MNYANERSQAALEPSSQDAFDVIRLTRSKAAVWTADDVARLIEILKKILTYFYHRLSRYHMIPMDDQKKIGHKTLRNSTLFIYLFIYLLYEYSKRFV